MKKSKMKSLMTSLVFKVIILILFFWLLNNYVVEKTGLDMTLIETLQYSVEEIREADNVIDSNGLQLESPDASEMVVKSQVIRKQALGEDYTYGGFIDQVYLKASYNVIGTMIGFMLFITPLFFMAAFGKNNYQYVMKNFYQELEKYRKSMD